MCMVRQRRVLFVNRRGEGGGILSVRGADAQENRHEAALHAVRAGRSKRCGTSCAVNADRFAGRPGAQRSHAPFWRGRSILTFAVLGVFNRDRATQFAVIPRLAASRAKQRECKQAALGVGIGGVAPSLRARLARQCPRCGPARFAHEGSAARHMRMRPGRFMPMTRSHRSRGASSSASRLPTRPRCPAQFTMTCSRPAFVPTSARACVT